MSTVHEIEQAIRSLAPADFAHLRDWILAVDHEAWDRPIENDAAAGKLDRFIEEARADLANGRCTDL